MRQDRTTASSSCILMSDVIVQISYHVRGLSFPFFIAQVFPSDRLAGPVPPQKQPKQRIQSHYDMILILRRVCTTRYLSTCGQYKSFCCIVIFPSINAGELLFKRYNWRQVVVLYSWVWTQQPLPQMMLVNYCRTQVVELLLACRTHCLK
jgi:hypothetical protein